MRFTMMLCLSALAAIAATAFLAVPLAAADEIVICAEAVEEGEECEKPLVTEVKEGKEYVQIHGTAEHPKLLSTLGTIECNESLANITVDNKLGESLLGEVTELKFEGECHIGKTKCEEVKTLSFGNVSFTKIGPLEASAKSDGGTTVKVKCGFIVNCVYGGEPILQAHSNEKGNTHLLANETILGKTEGFLCPEISKWDADYAASATMWIES